MDTGANIRGKGRNVKNSGREGLMRCAAAVRNGTVADALPADMSIYA
jgi:hypothetical protein